MFANWASLLLALAFSALVSVVGGYQISTSKSNIEHEGVVFSVPSDHLRPYDYPHLQKS